MLPQIIIHFKVTSGALHSAARAHLVILLEEKLAESLKKAGFFFFFWNIWLVNGPAAVRTKVFSFQLQRAFQNAGLAARRRGVRHCAALRVCVCP